MKFPEGNSELVLKENPNLHFKEIGIVCEDDQKTCERLKSKINAEV